MRRNRKSFGMKLWLCFILFTAFIFVALWLLQTIFLQQFYNTMVIKKLKHTASELDQKSGSDNLTNLIDDYAARDSLLIFLTDQQGNVIYSADEHNSVYKQNPNKDTESSSQDNPYHSSGTLMNWQIGAYRNLPQDYDDFLLQLSANKNGEIGYTTEDASAYIYGIRLTKYQQSSSKEEVVLYISTPLGAVGATAEIIRIQLAWVSLASLVMGFIISYFISRQFALPVSAISAQAKSMRKGKFDYEYKTGFCLELEELSDTLRETAAALKQSENTRRELLANISHDLRTPLTMIKGYAEILQEISWDDDSQRKEDLTVIIRETDRLTELVNDIMEFSSIQTSDCPVELKPIDLSAAAQSVVDQFTPLYQRNTCMMVFSLEPGQWVNGNEKQLKRVFYNLIDNAVCHTSNSMKIKVTLKCINDIVRVEIRDYGSGIPEDELPYIWDRYFTSKQRKNIGSSSGLGLAITKKILLLHKASFGVESKTGQGCLFWFELNKTTRP